MKTLIVVGAVWAAVELGWPVGVAVLMGGWLLHSYFYPWTACQVCGGNPRNTDKAGRSWNVYCPKCRGRGRRQRVGSRLLRRGFGEM